MYNLNVEISHRLSRDEALQYIEPLLREVKNRMPSIRDLEEQWKGHINEFRFAFTNIWVSGQISVGEKAVRIRGIVPLSAVKFKMDLTRVMEEEGQKLVSDPINIPPLFTSRE